MKQMRHHIYTLAFLLVLTHVHGQKKTERSNAPSKPLDSLVIGMKASKGLITTYLNQESTLYFELSQDLLAKELLIVTRLAQLPANYSGYINAGSKTSERVISFSKKGNKILMKEMSYTNISNEEDPISQSVSKNNYPAVLGAFTILNKESDRFLIDVSDYFMNDSPGFNIIRSSDKERYKIGSVDKNRSFIEGANSYPKNTEILHALSFKVQKPPRGNQSNTFSFQINHSIISLPDNPMQIRYEDKRVGWFTLSKIDYSSEALKADDFKIVRRWRLEPKDEAAYLNGELVEPIKPIVYYLDPATPIKWRKYFRLGIEDWNQVFEKAGFKNAIVAKDPPTAEEDPSFSPEDVRYSTVRYVASTTRNAVGPSVSDPRTGEILESDIIWYHNHLRSYRNRYLLETAAANPKARGLDTPEEEIGEMMRRVISHEVGHALGLPHNMKASSAYPVDSLRSGTFTQKYGIATTIMDYARYNYVAQPGDENIRFVRQLGPYDDYSIEWGYRYFGKPVDEEREILRKMVDAKSLDPMYMFGGRGNDPNAQTENIGDDPIKASNYGIKNLKIVGQNLMNWTLKPNSNYEDLSELYSELISVYQRYIYHVFNMVGGVHKTLHNSNQKGVNTFSNVRKTKQLAALRFLDKQLWSTQHWLMQKDLVSQINEDGGLLEIQRVQSRALQRLMSKNKLNKLLSSNNSLNGTGLSVRALLMHLYNTLVVDVTSPDISQQNLQLVFASQLKSLLDQDEVHPSIKAQLWDIRKALSRFAKKKEKSNGELLKAHYRYLKKISSENG